MLKQRVITAVILLAALSAALFLLSPNGWLLLMALVAGLGGWEWARLVGMQSFPCVVYGMVVTVLAAALGRLIGLHDTLALHVPLMYAICGVSAVFWLLAGPLWLRRKWPITGATIPMSVVGLVVLVPTALALAYLRLQGVGVLLFSMALIWVADIGAYFCGRAFGRNKLAPAISPGKTWEGAMGGGVAVLVLGSAVLFSQGYVAGVGHGVLAVVLLIALTAFSIMGDLFESLIKRQAGFKDSSQLLPGHGGILDRIDSLTLTMPLVCLFLLLSAS